MKTKEYFEEQLRVSFTMSELYELSSALATESFKETEAERNANAEKAWKLRTKVERYIEMYNVIYK